MTNGLQQNCTMASTLFNLYACAAVERWMERIRDLDDAGMQIMYKLSSSSEGP